VRPAQAAYEALDKLYEVPWQVMSQKYWQDVREERQAEFLVREFFPWSAICEVAVKSNEAASRVQSAISRAAHQPQVTVARLGTINGEANALRTRNRKPALG